MLPKLYDQLAAWWPLLSAPADYAEEAAFYARHLLAGRHSACCHLARTGQRRRQQCLAPQDTIQDDAR